MRLDAQELAAIQAARLALGPAGRLYLFGSRVDDARRGGDIDFYFESTRPIDLRTVLSVQYSLSSECDEKVDLIVKTPDQPKLPIHRIARRGIPL